MLESEYHGYVKRRKSNTRIEREVLEGGVAKRFDLRKGRYGYRPDRPRVRARRNRRQREKGTRRHAQADERQGPREKAKRGAFKYIELYYNKRRMRSAIDYNAPCDLERYVA